MRGGGGGDRVAEEEEGGEPAPESGHFDSLVRWAAADRHFSLTQENV